jgi:hypothetical protein
MYINGKLVCNIWHYSFLVVCLCTFIDTNTCTFTELLITNKLPPTYMFWPATSNSFRMWRYKLLPRRISYVLPRTSLLSRQHLTEEQWNACEEEFPQQRRAQVHRNNQLSLELSATNQHSSGKQ